MQKHARSVIALGFLLGFAWAAPARAAVEDANSKLLISMFTEACVRHTERPKGTLTYLSLNPFMQVADEAVLKKLLGEEIDGGAWITHTKGVEGNFVVALHRVAPTCGAYADIVDPAGAESVFRRVMEAVAQPGVTVTVEKDEPITTKTGTGKALTYRVDYASRHRCYRFALVVADKPGSLHDGLPLQASVELTTTELVD